MITKRELIGKLRGMGIPVVAGMVKKSDIRKVLAKKTDIKFDRMIDVDDIVPAYKKEFLMLATNEELDATVVVTDYSPGESASQDSPGYDQEVEFEVFHKKEEITDWLSKNCLKQIEEYILTEDILPDEKSAREAYEMDQAKEKRKDKKMGLGSTKRSK